jgi:hypothetical protein
MLDLDLDGGNFHFLEFFSISWPFLGYLTSEVWLMQAIPNQESQ